MNQHAVTQALNRAGPIAPPDVFLSLQNFSVSPSCTCSSGVGKAAFRVFT